MTALNYITILGCVLAIASGQILFKLTAGSVGASGQLWDLFLSPTLIAALVIYGIATLAWVWQLRYVNLSQAYPFMALSFVIVPLASTAILGEPITLRYWSGVGLIVGGIVLTVL
jgi:drug/metabolite transporter (DMT)-like permease